MLGLNIVKKKKQCKLGEKTQMDNFSSNQLILPIFFPNWEEIHFTPKVSSMRKLLFPISNQTHFYLLFFLPLVNRLIVLAGQSAPWA